MRRRIFGHLGLKVLSIALATLVWWMVAGQREAERSLRAPLEFRSIPDQLELVGEPAGLVDIRLRGTTGALAQLQTSEVVAVLDLKGARPGRRLFHILPGDVSVPTGIKVLQVTPATLSLTFESAAVRTGSGRARYRRRAGAGLRGWDRDLRSAAGRSGGAELCGG